MDVVKNKEEMNASANTTTTAAASDSSSNSHDDDDDDDEIMMTMIDASNSSLRLLPKVRLRVLSVLLDYKEFPKTKQVFQSLYKDSTASPALSSKSQFGRSPARTLSRGGNNININSTNNKSILTSHPAYRQKQAYLNGTTSYDQSQPNLSPLKDSMISPPKRSMDN